MAGKEIGVIGGGIVGLAVARSLLKEHRLTPIVLEAKNLPATQQTGHNSGVIHSGLYYRPGSRKAEDCAAGRETMFEYCRENDVPHERCGKLVLATSRDQLPALEELERRGRANGLEGIERLDLEGMRRHEPHIDGVQGLWVPQTGVVDFREVARAMVRELFKGGAEITTGARVTAIKRRTGGFELTTGTGKLEVRYLVNCGGLYCDRIARMCGLDPGMRIIPFRGEYHRLADDRQHLVRSLIYPVPDPALPFLGVHLTRRIDGTVEAGPNAVLALKREGYGRWSFSVRDALGSLSYPGFWRMAARYWKTGAGEYYRSLSRTALARDLRRMVPSLGPADLRRAGSGVRAQAVARDGTLVDDFRILESDGMLHVLNAPSPAATASIVIGRRIAERAAGSLGKV